MRCALATSRRLNMGEEVIGGPGAFAFDPTHVTFDVTGLGLSG
jgi:arginine decarboxylase